MHILITGIDVQLVPQDYSVNEADDNVTVNVRATGFPVQDFDVGNVLVILFTEDVTAVSKSASTT